MFDYETLRFIWWLLIGVILVVFMISDGFDMGIGCLLPLVARNDDERRIVINSVGAHWEGNQVWLILAGGALFAAWPRVYAAAFSGFYVWIAQSWDGDFARWRLVTTENCWCDSSAFTAGDQTRRTTGDAVLFAGGLLAVGWY